MSTTFATSVEEELSNSLIGRIARNFKDPLSRDTILSYLTNPSSVSIFPLKEQLIKETVPFKEHGTPPQFPPKSTLLLDNFISLQKWEGIVLEVMRDSFFGRLHDLTQNGPDEEAEFPLEEVSEDDRELIMSGAIFYWNIGYHDSRSGQRTRSSIIRFRRLPAWRKEQIEASKREANRIQGFIDWK